MFVLVVGGGKVGYYLTKELSESGHEVVLMEKDRVRADQIADEIGSIVVAKDGCEGSALAEAGANRADIVAAVTGDDEDNLVICQMAKHHFAVPKTIARVNNPKNEPLFQHLGVDELISPTRMILGSIEQDIPVHELLHLASLYRRFRAHRGAAGRRFPGGRPKCPRARASGRMRHRGDRPRRRRPGDPWRHDPPGGRQGHRDRAAGMRAGAPRYAHRGVDAGLIAAGRGRSWVVAGSVVLQEHVAAGGARIPPRAPPWLGRRKTSGAAPCSALSWAHDFVHEKAAGEATPAGGRPLDRPHALSTHAQCRSPGWSRHGRRSCWVGARGAEACPTLWTSLNGVRSLDNIIDKVLPYARVRSDSAWRPDRPPDRAEPGRPFSAPGGA